MPSGRIHAAATVALAPFAAGTAYMIGGVAAATWVGVGVLSGLMFSPDLDTPNLSLHWSRKLGIGWLWWLWWWPYRTIAKHRGASHAHLFGTLVRVAYGLPFTPVLWADPLHSTYWVVGLVLADSLHIKMDYWR